jgi:hypothetical protein
MNVRSLYEPRPTVKLYFPIVEITDVHEPSAIVLDRGAYPFSVILRRPAKPGLEG